MEINLKQLAKVQSELMTTDTSGKTSDILSNIIMMVLNDENFVDETDINDNDEMPITTTLMINTLIKNKIITIK
jgi:hypothetical protein